MKYICLGYLDEKKWETVPENERHALMDECFAYDDVLRKNVTSQVEKRCKVPGTRSRCVGRAVRSPSPMVRTPKRKSSWAESSCSRPRI